MDFESTTLPDVKLIIPKLFSDKRGFFFESWHDEKFTAAGVLARFVQDNQSHSVRHTLRGLHYQLEHPQGKLVRVTRGEAYDVVVDIRRSSPTFGRWFGTLLSETNHRMLWVPPGLAHGYLALSEGVDFVYKCTEFYFPQDERAIRWNDPSIGIRWPIPPGEQPILSEKDAKAPLLEAAVCYV